MSDKFRGYDIYSINGTWYFSDTNEKVESAWENRPCGHCNLFSTPEGHDGCLGTLSGVMNACCGHGQESDAYIQFVDGQCIRGESASIAQRNLKKQ